MRTIYKYEIDPKVPDMEMPVNAEILKVAFQGDAFCLWAVVDTGNDMETRFIHAFGTGHEIHQNMGVDYRYIGTGFMHNGLVFHAFERFGL